MRRLLVLYCAVKFSIGKVFDEEGNFYEEGLAREVKGAVEKFRQKKFDSTKKTK
jgi:hypothetical protein